MLTTTEDTISIDHIMWQPRFDCRMSCKNCYLSDSPAVLGPSSTDIVSLIYKENRVGCKQFTISLDTVTRANEKLVECLGFLWERYEKGYALLPALCITAFNLNTVLFWARTIRAPLRQFLQPLSILSLSNFPPLGLDCQQLKDTCKETGTQLNYNRMVTGNEQDNKSFQIAVRYADMVHLVLRKKPLGVEQDPQDMVNWMKAKDLIPEEKLQEDACVRESIRKTKTDFACSAGISKVHVWPDGSVTGCPYDSQLLMSEANESPTDLSLWEELEYAVLERPCHSMKFCKILLRLLCPSGHLLV